MRSFSGGGRWHCCMWWGPPHRSKYVADIAAPMPCIAGSGPRPGSHECRGRPRIRSSRLRPAPFPRADMAEPMVLGTHPCDASQSIACRWCPSPAFPVGPPGVAGALPQQPASPVPYKGGGSNKSMDNADDAVRNISPLNVAFVGTSAYPPIKIRAVRNTHTRV